MSDLDKVLDHRGSTLEDLVDAVEMNKVDRLVKAFERCASKVQSLTAVEAIVAAHVFAGSTAMEIIPNPDQRKAVCEALAGYVVGPEAEGLQ